MNKDYTIDWMERKEWEGKKLINATLVDEGTVTIWELDQKGQAFPGFADLMPGGTVSGQLWVNPKNGKKTLYPPKAQNSMGFPRRPAISQEEKNKGIKEAQDRKEESIAFFNATNAAIAIVKELYNFKETVVAPTTIRAAIADWRDWFLREHKNYKDKPPF